MLLILGTVFILFIFPFISYIYWRAYSLRDGILFSGIRTLSERQQKKVALVATCISLFSKTLAYIYISRVSEKNDPYLTNIHAAKKEEE